MWFRAMGVVFVSVAAVACGPVVHVVPSCEHDCLANDGGTGGGTAGSGGGFAERVNFIFVTPGKYQLGSLGDGDGGVPVADAICNAVAMELGHQGTYVALLSTSKVDLRDRIPAGITGWASAFEEVFDLPGSPRMKGRIGAVGAPASGEPPVPVATGSTNWGTAAASNCEDWMSSDAGSTLVIGDSTALISGWAEQGEATCDQLLPIYCAQIDRAATIGFAPAAGVRRVFVTEALYPSGNGRSGFDRACQTEATAASLEGRFAAYVSTQGRHAGADLEARSVDYFRMDGARTSQTTTIELFNPLYRYPAQLTASGRTLVSESFAWPDTSSLLKTDTAVWFGDPQGEATTCNDWFSTRGTAVAADATSLLGDHWNLNLLAPSSVRDCGLTAHVFCVELP